MFTSEFLDEAGGLQGLCNVARQSRRWIERHVGVSRNYRPVARNRCAGMQAM